MSNWNVGFAYLPHHTTSGEWVWLQKIEWRISPYSPMGLTNQYRKIR